MRFKVILIAIVSAVVFSLGGCSMLNLSGGNQKQTSALYFAEIENIDGTFTYAYQMTIPTSVFTDFGIAATALSARLAENFAHLMYILPLEEIATAEGSTLSATKTSDGGLELRYSDWPYVFETRAQTSDGEYVFLAAVTADTRTDRMFFDVLEGNKALGVEPVAEIIDLIKDENSELPDKDSYIFHNNNAMYKIGGYRFSNPVRPIVDNWTAAYAGGDSALKELWGAYSVPALNAMLTVKDAPALKSLIGQNAFSEISDGMKILYQFRTSEFTGCNGIYQKSPGTRDMLWHYTVGESAAGEIEIFYRSPRVWFWYLLGALITAAIAVLLYFMLRMRPVRVASSDSVNQPPSYRAPQYKPPEPESNPFGDEYGKKKTPEENPFGTDDPFEN